MRSNCRSLLFALALLTGFASQAAYADNKAAADNGPEADTTKCPPGASANGGGPAGAANVAGGPGRAGGHRYHGGFGGEGPFGRMPLDLSMLNLSEEQKTKISTIRGRNAARAKEIRQQLGTKKGEMRDLMFSADAGNDSILAKHNEVKALIDEAESLRMNDFLAMRAVITPEQRKKWAEYRATEMKNHGPKPDN